MAALRALGRFALVLLWVVWGVWTVHTGFARRSAAQRQALVRLWSQRMLSAMGVRLRCTGADAAAGPLLWVANHLSWLDILVMNAVQPARFVSKADVKHWPVLGALVAGAGTLFIERESRRDAMRVVHHMAEALGAGDVVAVFPEGTTGDGQAVLPFHANLLQAAIATHVPVQPVALAYVDGRTGQRSSAALYVGDTTLLGSVWQTLCASRLEVHVTLGEAETAQGRDRRTWAADLRGHIQDLLSPHVRP
jgi:1-acyl-sn-glycerol-3-phosphate acyltransferase